MGLPRQARNISKMVSLVIGRSWASNLRIRNVMKAERPFGDYWVEHTNGAAAPHHAGESCSTCESLAKKATAK
jgi:hypothetical protein